MEDLYDNNVTIISNEFLNKYLSDTKPEYIKVFLFYLWKGLKENYSIEDAATELDLDESDVEKALKYWVKKKVMKKECLQGNKEEKKEDNNKDSNKLLNFDTKKQELIDKKRKDYSEVEEEILWTSEKILRQTLSETQRRLIVKCYNEYGFDEAIIYHLFEYCYNNSTTEARYMGRIAESWYEQKVRTVDEAKAITDAFKKGTAKTKSKSSKTNKLNRDEYNEWFKNNVLKNK